MPRRAPSKKRCSTGDAACDMDNMRLADVLPHTCTSLSCLARDLSCASSAEEARDAIFTRDRPIYAAIAATLLLLLAACLMRRRHESPRFYLPYEPYVR